MNRVALGLAVLATAVTLVVGSEAPQPAFGLSCAVAREDPAAVLTSETVPFRDSSFFELWDMAVITLDTPSAIGTPAISRPESDTRQETGADTSGLPRDSYDSEAPEAASPPSGANRLYALTIGVGGLALTTVAGTTFGVRRVRGRNRPRQSGRQPPVRSREAGPDGRERSESRVAARPRISQAR